MALSDRLEHLGKKLQERRLELNPALNKKKGGARIASRTDFSDESIGPNMSVSIKPKPKSKKTVGDVKNEVMATGNIGARGMMGEGEVNPFAAPTPAPAPVAAPVEAPIQYPSRTADVVPEDVAAASSAADPKFNASNPMGMKKGGSVKAKAKPKTKYMSSGGSTSSRASSRGDGCAQRGKTKGRMV